MAKKIDVEQLKTDLTTKAPGVRPVAASDLLSSGSTLVNLASSGRIAGAFAKGTYTLLVGDSESGKTWLAMTAFAEAALSSRFDGYRLVYDPTENGALMSLEQNFGRAVADRLELPGVDADGQPCCSPTAEIFYDNVKKYIAAGVPFVYVLDSENGLGSTAEIKKAKLNRKARATGEAEKGDMGDGKARVHSRGLRGIIRGLEATGSILIIIGQTRDDLRSPIPGAKTRSGGRALKLYAHTEIWCSTVGQIRKTVLGKPRIIGQTSRFTVKKNRINGRKATVDVPILNNYGIDDIGGCIDYLTEEGHWTQNAKGILTAPDFDFVGRPGKLIKQIEDNGTQRDLRRIVGTVWQKIIDASTPDRKPRYG